MHPLFACGAASTNFNVSMSGESDMQSKKNKFVAREHECFPHVHTKHNLPKRIAVYTASPMIDQRSHRKMAAYCVILTLNT